MVVASPMDLRIAGVARADWKRGTFPRIGQLNYVMVQLLVVFVIYSTQHVTEASSTRPPCTPSGLQFIHSSQQNGKMQYTFQTAGFLRTLTNMGDRTSTVTFEFPANCNIEVYEITFQFRPYCMFKVYKAIGTATSWTTGQWLMDSLQEKFTSGDRPHYRITIRPPITAPTKFRVTFEVRRSVSRYQCSFYLNSQGKPGVVLNARDVAQSSRSTFSTAVAQSSRSTFTTVVPTTSASSVVDVASTAGGVTTTAASSTTGDAGTTASQLTLTTITTPDNTTIANIQPNATPNQYSGPPTTITIAVLLVALFLLAIGILAAIVVRRKRVQHAKASSGREPETTRQQVNTSQETTRQQVNTSQEQDAVVTGDRRSPDHIENQYSMCGVVPTHAPVHNSYQQGTECHDVEREYSMASASTGRQPCCTYDVPNFENRPVGNAASPTVTGIEDGRSKPSQRDDPAGEYDKLQGNTGLYSLADAPNPKPTHATTISSRPQLPGTSTSIPASNASPMCPSKPAPSSKRTPGSVDTPCQGTRAANRVVTPRQAPELPRPVYAVPTNNSIAQHGPATIPGSDPSAYLTPSDEL